MEQKQETAKLNIVNKNNEIAKLQLGTQQPSTEAGREETGPIETSQSEPLKASIDSPAMKLDLNAVGSGRPDVQIQQLAKEIAELESQVRSMRQTLEDCYKKQRDLANERAKIKQKFQSVTDMAVQSTEILKMLLRQHILIQQNLDYEHKSTQQEVQLKIKEAQTYSLSEQLRVRDDIIARTRNALKE